jgi:predicted aspartyl protease
LQLYLEQMAQAFQPRAARILLPAIIIFAAAAVCAIEPPADLKSLYEAHQWFQLRDAISTTKASALFRGAVFSAFNQRDDAEKLLLGVVAAAPRSRDAASAREFLIHLYVRSGQYSRAIPLMAAQLSAAAKAASKGDEALISTFVQIPEQTVSSRGVSKLRYEVSDAGLSVPISVNGNSGNFLLDTDSNMSVIAESEARRLDMLIIHSDVPVSGVTGNTSDGARVALARELVVGNFHFKNVNFLVLNDDQAPFAELPAGKRGILGLPVILAFQTVRWNRGGTFDIGFAAATMDLSRANLCFDSDDPITQLEFSGRKLEFVFDTGASESELWPSFARDFAALLKQSGKNESRTLTGFTGSDDVAVVTLPEIHLGLGEFVGTLRPVSVLTRPTVGPSNWFYGRAGMDILDQAQTVTIDFVAMTVRLN